MQKLYYQNNNKHSKELYTEYAELAKEKDPSILFDNHLGRLRYYNLDQTIMAALQTSEREFENK